VGIAEKRAERSIERVPAGVGSRLAEDWFVDPATRRPGYAPDPLQIDPVGLEPIVPAAPEIAPLSLLFGGGAEEEGRLGWQDEALCAQTDPEAFFPEKGGSTREAKRVCGTCDVRSECLEYALENDERFGIWGGLSERERRKLKKRVV
jgi:WhiB family redox-sensing transcriptional regulator